MLSVMITKPNVQMNTHVVLILQANMDAALSQMLFAAVMEFIAVLKVTRVILKVVAVGKGRV